MKQKILWSAAIVAASVVALAFTHKPAPEQKQIPTPEQKQTPAPEQKATNVFDGTAYYLGGGEWDAENAFPERPCSVDGEFCSAVVTLVSGAGGYTPAQVAAEAQSQAIYNPASTPAAQSGVLSVTMSNGSVYNIQFFERAII